jgi:hypothetical protein
MKRRIATWTSVGFLVACCWVLYSFVAPPDFLLRSLREPVAQAGFITCPILFFARHFPLHFWWVPPINAATYAVACLLLEMLRRKLQPGLQPG